MYSALSAIREQRARSLALNPQLVKAEKRAHFITFNQYTDEIFESLAGTEAQYLPNLKSFKSQREISSTMRLALIDFIIDKCSKMGLCQTTLFSAINLFDRYCSTRHLKKEHLELLGLTCLWIASKYNDIKYKIVQLNHLLEFINHRFSKNLFKQMEVHVLNNLNWLIASPTQDVFIDYFLCKSYTTSGDFDDTFTKHYYDFLKAGANFICELALMYPAISLVHKPSKLAYYSLQIMNNCYQYEFQGQLSKPSGSQKPLFYALLDCFNYRFPDAFHVKYFNNNKKRKLNSSPTETSLNITIIYSSIINYMKELSAVNLRLEKQAAQRAAEVAAAAAAAAAAVTATATVETASSVSADAYSPTLFSQSTSPSTYSSYNNTSILPLPSGTTLPPISSFATSSVHQPVLSNVAPKSSSPSKYGSRTPFVPDHEKCNSFSSTSSLYSSNSSVFSTVSSKSSSSTINSPLSSIPSPSVVQLSKQSSRDSNLATEDMRAYENNPQVKPMRNLTFYQQQRINSYSEGVNSAAHHYQPSLFTYPTVLSSFPAISNSSLKRLSLVMASSSRSHHYVPSIDSISDNDSVHHVSHQYLNVPSDCHQHPQKNHAYTLRALSSAPSSSSSFSMKPLHHQISASQLSAVQYHTSNFNNSNNNNSDLSHSFNQTHNLNHNNLNHHPNSYINNQPLYHQLHSFQSMPMMNQFKDSHRFSTGSIPTTVSINNAKFSTRNAENESQSQESYRNKKIKMFSSSSSSSSSSGVGRYSKSTGKEKKKKL